MAATSYELIREYSTTEAVNVTLPDSKRKLSFVNTNRLVRGSDWQIGLSKTGYISESGLCLVMQAIIGNQPVVIVLLDSWGKLTRVGDANRIKKWLERNPGKMRSG
jgi:D-alanyl-D-alanine endopeptidase (penicillin-binding protein 7)